MYFFLWPIKKLTKKNPVFDIFTIWPITFCGIIFLEDWENGLQKNWTRV